MKRNNLLSFFAIALMLFLQSTSLAHEIEHIDGEHTEICEIYLTAEKHSTIESFSASVPITIAASTVIKCATQASLAAPSPAYSSRAPPSFK